MMCCISDLRRGRSGPNRTTFAEREVPVRRTGSLFDSAGQAVGYGLTVHHAEVHGRRVSPATRRRFR